MGISRENIMMSENVICIAGTEEQAADIIDKLKSEKFSKDDVSVLYSDTSGSRSFAHEKHTKAPEGMATGASSGGVLGAAIGWLAGVGALATPVLGPLIAAGPIMALLSGAGIGAAIGGVTGVLVGLGIPEYEAKRYEGKLKEGNILISVHVKNTDQRKKVEEIYQEFGAKDIAATGEWSMSSEINQLDQPELSKEPQGPKREDEQRKKEQESKLDPKEASINKDSTISTTGPKGPEVPGEEEPRV
ncbi:MAG: hypothetical protein WD038_10730 [Balneolales bacterium]